MGNMTNEQLSFFARHKIPLTKVFDARGMGVNYYQELMRDQEKYFAFGTEPCQKGGHTLRSRSGHCVQCDTARIAFMMRAVKEADVYIAASRSKKFIKIGSSTELARRIDYLSKESYGGADDWICVAKVRCAKAGSVEFEAQKKLSNFRTEATYNHSGRLTDAYEIFSCDYRSARIALIASVPEAERKGLWERPDALLNYNFLTDK
jgi:T5orf172 domain